MQWTSQCLPLNALHYCLSLNAQKTLKPQSDDIWEMEKNKNEWMTEYMHIAARLLYTCVCKIFQAPELQNINCMREQQVTFMLIPLLWKWKRTKYHIQNYVKKKTQLKKNCFIFALCFNSTSYKNTCLLSDFETQF